MPHIPLSAGDMGSASPGPGAMCSKVKVPVSKPNGFHASFGKVIIAPDKPEHGGGSTKKLVIKLGIARVVPKPKPKPKPKRAKKLVEDDIAASRPEQEKDEDDEDDIDIDNNEKGSEHARIARNSSHSSSAHDLRLPKNETRLDKNALGLNLGVTSVVVKDWSKVRPLKGGSFMCQDAEALAELAGHEVDEADEGTNLPIEVVKKVNLLFRGESAQIK